MIKLIWVLFVTITAIVLIQIAPGPAFDVLMQSLAVLTIQWYLVT